MRIIDSIKGLFTSKEVEQANNLPASINQNTQSIEFEFDDDSRDYSDEEWAEIQFDNYARAYHSAETDEERQQIYNQDNFWMMQ